MGVSGLCPYIHVFRLAIAVHDASAALVNNIAALRMHLEYAVAPVSARRSASAVVLVVRVEVPLDVAVPPAVEEPPAVAEPPPAEVAVAAVTVHRHSTHRVQTTPAIPPRYHQRLASQLPGEVSQGSPYMPADTTSC